ncbi:RagB/SusD family nutrient uptake outer membrane protein [Flavivirga sp. 57AJ16]|uniref:RagB/SusD family nutrient uptake outer membrane protein n=1 Tax=Flavivirga sp. 57AJ16 TaxID=3025307 RepID=UPI002365680C|nr:RagB/SusD family nutrient uptake outer membrane protein [Flavivirga sp. 57AJ16]MDD7888137.1 RagB/SusD family nutrient uptake outer membrane protein [Flavivirga sp. 57AJ16]
MKLKNNRISFYSIKNILVFSALLFGFNSCDDFVEVDLPPDLINTDAVFKNEGSAQSAMRGIYAYTNQSNATSYMFTIVGLSSDELEKISYTVEETMFATNTIASNSSTILNMWRGFYNIIYQCNNAILNIPESTELSEDTKDQLVGEAKFIRAFIYFYLVNLWGDVPINLITDYDVIRLLPRASVAEVYEQIEADLLDAQSKLSSELYTLAGERIRANKWAATALLARVMLYQENWTDAETQASAVINSGFYQLESLTDVFFATSRENIMQFASSGNNRYTFANLTGSSVTNPRYRLTSFISNNISDDDERRSEWLTPNLNGSYKYKAYSNTRGPEDPEAVSVLRLAEMYLIRAEARAQQANITGLNSAESDLNVIRSRAGLQGTAATTKATMLQDIYIERTREFFGEWGHRWLDVKRIGQADAVFGTNKAEWVSQAALYPIPFEDIQRNPNLTQNPEY